MAQHIQFVKGRQSDLRLRHASGLHFSDLLTPELVNQAMAKLGLKFRARVYSPLVTIWTFLSQVLSADHSCREAVARVLAWRVAQGLAPCSADTSSYCQARLRLPLELIQHLARQVGQEMTRQADPSWLWKGRHVKIVDGSTVTMADTEANQQEYPQSRSQKPGLGFPIARVVAIFSLSCGGVLDAVMGPMRGKRTGETTLFRRLYGALEHGDVLLVDCLFAGFRDLAMCALRGIDVVASQHVSRRTDFRRGRWLGRLDHVVTLRRSKFCAARFTREEWEQLPEEIQVRELRYNVLEAGFRPRVITLVTTLLDPVAYSAEEIATLYRERWHCELDLRSLKQSLQMERLRCETPEMVRKELWMHLLAFNLIRQTASEAAGRHHMSPRSISFKGTVQTINAFATHLPLCPRARLALWTAMLRAITTHRVGDRPNRVEPRRLKRRLAKYPYLTCPRTEARRRLCA